MAQAAHPRNPFLGEGGLTGRRKSANLCGVILLLPSMLLLRPL